jgi:hypothetical protein
LIEQTAPRIPATARAATTHAASARMTAVRCCHFGEPQAASWSAAVQCG